MNFERTKVEDFTRSLQRVDKILETYEPIHKGAWRFQLIRTHVEHSCDHGDAAWRTADAKDHDPNIEENLASHACRALMALELYLEKHSGDPLAADDSVPTPANYSKDRKEKES